LPAVQLYPIAGEEATVYENIVPFTVEFSVRFAVALLQRVWAIGIEPDISGIGAIVSVYTGGSPPRGIVFPQISVTEVIWKLYVAAGNTPTEKLFPLV